MRAIKLLILRISSYLTFAYFIISPYKMRLIRQFQPIVWFLTIVVGIRDWAAVGAFFREVALEVVDENSMIRAAPLSVKMLASPWKMIQANNRTNGTWVMIRKTWESKNNAVTLLTWGFMSWKKKKKKKKTLLFSYFTDAKKLQFTLQFIIFYCLTSFYCIKGYRP